MLGFRVWDKVLNMMIVSDTELYIYMDSNLGQLRDGDIDRYILMQSTGLKDSYGTLIYEKDILKIGYNSAYDNKFHTRYVVVESISELINHILIPSVCINQKDGAFFMVCGNQFQNPELLEKV